MVDEVENGDDAGTPEGDRPNRMLTVPNVICVARLLGSLVLVELAWAGRGDLFLWLFVALVVSDWIDGKLAILLNQRSAIGPLLDSWADAALYCALLFGALLLHGESLRAELVWIGAAVGSYALSTVAGLWKFGRWPSYHTRTAKTSWFLIAIGALGLFGGWSLWPLRIALAAVVLTNLEALLITLVSPVWREDVGSVFRVLRERKTGG